MGCVCVCVRCVDRSLRVDFEKGVLQGWANLWSRSGAAPSGSCE